MLAILSDASVTAPTHIRYVIALSGALLLPSSAHAAGLIACMTAHKDEMKALNTQIAELEQMKVKPGGPKTKPGECTDRLHAIRGSAPLPATDKNTVDHREKIACLAVKKTLLEQRCACESKGLEFSADPAVIEATLAAHARFADAQKASRKGSLRPPPEVRKIAEETQKVRGCYSKQVIEIINKATAAVEKIARAK